MSGGRLQATLSLLSACRTPSHLHQLHAHALKTSLDADPVVAGKLLILAAVSLAGTLPHALRLFSFLPPPASRDPFLHNALIRGLAESDRPSRSLLAYTSMRRAAVPPDSFSFAFALKAAANAPSPSAGEQLHAQAALHGLDANVFVATTLVSMYAECGRGDSALRVFDGMPHRNVVTWNAAITACLRCGDLAGAEGLFSRAPSRDITTWNLLLAGYMKDGELGLARRTFHEMPTRDPVSWSTMVTGLAKDGNFEEAFCFFHDSFHSGLRPNEVSLAAVLSACAHGGALELGRIVHGYIEKVGLKHVVAVSNALLDAYAKCGSMDMARRVFDRWLEVKSIVSWTVMIAGLAMHGYGEEAMRIFHEMEEQGVIPDGIAFIAILYACSHAGLVEQGYDYFCKMEERYGIERSMEHYGCMVDLYGRAGLLDEAYKFITHMPIQPDAIIWRTLLGACSIHGNLKLAKHVKKQLSELDDSGDYVLLSNIYAVAGKWKDASDMRRSMSSQKMRKMPGWSAIEAGKVVYRFVASDESDVVREEANAVLEEMMSRLMEEGYVPEVASVVHDIEDEEKHHVLARHSEKLAVAFGVAKTCPGSVIRIVKNLRVCRDCHTVMKLISKVYGREIVVRDRSRFHSFTEGSCSCKDYW
uniref:Pentatricopeptide repeat-containing protein At1g74630 n=1 Tax=Anthurium amnicola TaxID=1678845 RepID=A0A1D1YUW0_9ARAE